MESAIDMAAVGQFTGVIGQWDQGATCLAALALAVDPGIDSPLRDAALEVIDTAGLGYVLTAPQRLPFSPLELHGIVASPLLQGASLVTGTDPSWAGGSDPVLLAQGHTSGSAALLFASFILPHQPALAERLYQPGGRMLDVGTGIGALALGFAQTFPQLHVTGIDVMARVLDLARTHLATSPAGTRVQLRHQSVTDLNDQATYDLAWLPAPFIPPPALELGMANVVAALKPGGLLMVGHGRFDGTDLQNAITRFKVTAYGGTALDARTATAMLTNHGLTAVHTAPTPPGAPAITIGTK